MVGLLLTRDIKGAAALFAGPGARTDPPLLAAAAGRTRLFDIGNQSENKRLTLHNDGRETSTVFYAIVLRAQASAVFDQARDDLRTMRVSH